MKTITIDIDGVLNNYPACWLDYIELQKNQKFNSIEEAKKTLGTDVYSEIKDSYRTSGYKSKLPVNPTAPNFTRLLKEKGYNIVVATSRPFHLYPGLEKLTFDWLKANNIIFDKLERKNALLMTSYTLNCHIDDELDHVHQFLKEKINVFIIKRDDIKYEGYEDYESLRFVSNLNEVLGYIE
ncbi:MAG: hypothetical protein V4608_01840 [Bacteroidota bacterium]